MQKIKVIVEALVLVFVLWVCISIAYWIDMDFRRWGFKNKLERFFEEDRLMQERIEKNKAIREREKEGLIELNFYTHQELIKHSSTFLDSEIE